MPGKQTRHFINHIMTQNELHFAQTQINNVTGWTGEQFHLYYKTSNDTRTCITQLVGG